MKAFLKNLSVVLLVLAAASACADDRLYENKLTRIKNPKPLLADHPEFVAPVKELGRFEAPPIVDDKDANLHVRAWRFSYNARGIDRKSTRLNSSHSRASRMPSSA